MTSKITAKKAIAGTGLNKINIKTGTHILCLSQLGDINLYIPYADLPELISVLTAHLPAQPPLG